MASEGHNASPSQTPGGSLDRGLAAISLQLDRTLRRKEDAYLELGLREVQQQFQVDASGDVAGVLRWDHSDVTFDFPFSWAPSNRESDLVYPQFSYGAFLPIENATTGAATLTAPEVLLTALVTHFFRHPDTDTFTGARVWIGAVVPDASPTELVSFEASIHLTFQGFASPGDDESDLE